MLYVADAWTFCFVIIMASNEIYERKFYTKPKSTSESPKFTETSWEENQDQLLPPYSPNQLYSPESQSDDDESFRFGRKTNSNEFQIPIRESCVYRPPEQHHSSAMQVNDSDRISVPRRAERVTELELHRRETSMIEIT